LVARPDLRFLARFAADETGATMVEYAIFAGVLGVALVTAFSVFETQLYDILNRAATAIEAAIS
jgi:pilus assembly protein Flp/PilA